MGCLREDAGTAGIAHLIPCCPSKDTGAESSIACPICSRGGEIKAGSATSLSLQGLGRDAWAGSTRFSSASPCDPRLPTGGPAEPPALCPPPSSPWHLHPSPPPWYLPPHRCWGFGWEPYNAARHKKKPILNGIHEATRQNPFQMGCKKPQAKTHFEWDARSRRPKPILNGMQEATGQSPFRMGRMMIFPICPTVGSPELLMGRWGKVL